MPSERNQILTFIYQPTHKDEVDRELKFSFVVVIY